MEILLVLLLLIAYFVPATTAMARGHHNTGAITVLNIFLGWTFIGWVVALVWAFTAVKAARVPPTNNDGY